MGGIDADNFLDLFLDPIRFGRGKVDLVEDGDDLVIVVDRLIDVGQRLRFDALGGVDDEQRTFAGAERTRDFIGEVDMAGRVDQIEDIGLAIVRLVMQADGLGLDGNAAFALDIHRVENLFRHVAFGKAAGRLDQTVGQGRLAVVDMGHDREVADMVKRRAGIGAHGSRIYQ
ncbi:hypothetical protein D3C80_716870 [compost metagenome]